MDQVGGKCTAVWKWWLNPSSTKTIKNNLFEQELNPWPPVTSHEVFLNGLTARNSQSSASLSENLFDSLKTFWQVTLRQSRRHSGRSPWPRSWRRRSPERLRRSQNDLHRWWSTSADVATWLGRRRWASRLRFRLARCCFPSSKPILKLKLCPG